MNQSYGGQEVLLKFPVACGRTMGPGLTLGFIPLIVSGFIELIVGARR